MGNGFHYDFLGKSVQFCVEYVRAFRQYSFRFQFQFKWRSSKTKDVRSNGKGDKLSMYM